MLGVSGKVDKTGQNFRLPPQYHRSKSGPTTAKISQELPFRMWQVSDVLCRGSIGKSEYLHGLANTLQADLTSGFNLKGILHRYTGPRAEKDVAIFGLVAKARSKVDRRT